MGKDIPVFKYDLSHLDLKGISSKSDLTDLMRKHDEDSLKFCENAAILNVAIGKLLGIRRKKDLKLLYECGLFHDIGKIGMSKEFLNYPGAYSIQMYNEMKKHTSGGAEILKMVNAEEQLINTAKYHHNNYDGSGYPGSLFEKAIPLNARITRVSDSVDAYMSKRCYKEGGPVGEVLSDLKQYEGTSYDPDVLKSFGTIHKKVMSKCHEEGMDHPPQHIYMHFTKILFLQEEMESSDFLYLL